MLQLVTSVGQKWSSHVTNDPPPPPKPPACVTIQDIERSVTKHTVRLTTDLNALMSHHGFPDSHGCNIEYILLPLTAPPGISLQAVITGRLPIGVQKAGVRVPEETTCYPAAELQTAQLPRHIVSN